MRPTNSSTPTAIAKAEPGTPEYQDKVAKPVMAAVDGMPAAYRALVHELGYVGVYRAWRQGWSVEKIKADAKFHGGRFEL